MPSVQHSRDSSLAGGVTSASLMGGVFRAAGLASTGWVNRRLPVDTAYPSSAPTARTRRVWTFWFLSITPPPCKVAGTSFPSPVRFSLIQGCRGSDYPQRFGSPAPSPVPAPSRSESPCATCRYRECSRAGRWAGSGCSKLSLQRKDPPFWAPQRRVRLARIETLLRTRGVVDHSLAGPLAVQVDLVPVAAPLPDVAGHVVQAVAVGREGLDRRGALVAVLPPCSCRETRPARCWRGCWSSVGLSSPQT